MFGSSPLGMLSQAYSDFSPSIRTGDLNGFGYTAGQYATDGTLQLVVMIAGGKMMKVHVATAEIQSLGAGRSAVKQWLQNVGNLERGELIQNLQSAGFSQMSPSTSPVMVFERGGMRVRIDPPQSGTPFHHMHLEYGGSSHDVLLNPVNYKSSAAHIPIQ